MPGTLWQQLKHSQKVPDPDPGEHVLNGFFSEKNARGNFRKAICVEIDRKTPQTLSAHGILCEPAQSKRTWTFQKSHHFAQ